MSNNSLGNVFRVTSFGESHGTAVGCVIDGMPAGLHIDVAKIQAAVNLRKTNQTSYASQRAEDDIVEIISGVYNQTTLGSPICIVIKNTDAKSTDYDNLENIFRPNHADYTNFIKYGFRDHRGGGRSSIRITAPLVAAGEMAKQLLQHYTPITIQSFVCGIGDVSIPKAELQQLFTDEKIWSNAVRSPIEKYSNAMTALIDETKLKKDTLGGLIHTNIYDAPIGIGEPIFGKLQAQLAHAMFSINTVKGFAYGDGFDAAKSKGTQHNDVFVTENDVIKTATNHSGGIQGGISNGMPIYFTTAFKPISSIAQSQQTVDKNKQNTSINITGRHDVCAVPRAVPIVNAYTAIVLTDLFLQQKNAKI
jgi:chorismate synthase